MNMGKLINMMQSNLFGKKKQIDTNKSNENLTENDSSSSSFSSTIFTVNNTSRADQRNLVRELFAADVTTSTITATSKSENVLGEADIEANVNKAMERKVYELERYYIFEQNNTIDKYEAEKTEMQATHADEKTLMKRAFEHEKDELLKEIERKDKILFELTKVMKEEYGKKLERQKNELTNIINEKQRSLTCMGEKFKVLVDNVNYFIDNSVTKKVADLKELLQECETIISSVSDATKEPCTVEGATVRSYTEVKSTTVSAKQNTRETRLVKTEEEKKERTFANEPFNEKRNQTTNPKVITRTLSDCIGLKNECCRIHSIGDEAIQHELAQAYRKQKSELLKLFSSEKEEYQNAINKDKDAFERETREEYIQRMAVERKAWQETIEDLERELAILKYERQQMDTNYCLGMDQLKTEFEREKNIIHRRYKESCLQWKKNIEEKMKNTKIVEEIDKTQDSKH